MASDDGVDARRLDAMLAAIIERSQALPPADAASLVERRQDIARAAELLIRSYGPEALNHARELENRLKSPFAAAVTRAVLAALS